MAAGVEAGTGAGAAPRLLVGALGLVQVLAWGSSFYLATVLARPMAEDTGWPLSLLAGGVSLGLLVSGLAAPRVGRLIAAHGGRPVMAGGFGLLALGLAVLGLAPHPAVYVLGWVVLGLGMSATLYDAAFSTLVGALGTGTGEGVGAGEGVARRGITAITLFGGFASTVCWPLSAFLVAQVGWRGACLAYGGLMLAVCLPLILLAVPRVAPRAAQRVLAEMPALSQSAPPTRPILAGPQRLQFLLLASVLMLAGFLATVLLIHLVTLVQANGVAAADAVALGMLIGPAQVGARLLELAFGGRLHPIRTLLVASVLTALGLGLLALDLPFAALHLPAVALLLYGAGNGILTIVRGALPLALFGPRDYPLVMGLLARPGQIAVAAAPALGGLLLDHLGAEVVLGLMAGLAVANVALVGVLVRVGEGRRRSRKHI